MKGYDDQGFIIGTSAEAKATLRKGYLKPGQTVQDVHIRVANGVSSYYGCSLAIRNDIITILKNGWLGLATPVATNYNSGTDALPISCYSVHLDDSINSIFSHTKEVSSMSKLGGGVGVYLGDVRPSNSEISTGGTATGVVPVAGIYDRIGNYVSQGGVRRGAFAFYLPIEHPDVPQLLESKSHFGDPRTYIDSNIALTVTDEFMNKVLNGDKEASKLWSKVLETQMKSGSPYLLFIDNVNNQNPQCYKDRNLKVSTSNLCSEVTGHTDEDHSFVCCLSSLNIASFQEWCTWQGTSGLTVVELAIYLLDAVMEEFIQKASKVPSMGRAVRFAEKSRMLGLGVMGMHYAYQLRGFPFKSFEARQFNKAIFKKIKIEADSASKQLAEVYGEPEWCKGSGYRNTHRIAIAPTRSNSVISGAFSAGIEPITSNIYVAKEAKGSFVRKNRLLEALLEKKGKNTEEVWDSILKHNGSCMHLGFLTYDEKQVFLTAREISQMELVRQTAERQLYVDQAISLNRFYHPDTPISEINRHVFAAWNNGVKSLYYTKSSSDSVIKAVENKAHIVTKPNCPYCEKAKQLMRLNNIEYTEYSRDDIQRFCFKTLPQIHYQGHYVGGYEQFKELLEIQKKRVIGNFKSEESNDCAACEA